MNKYRLMIAGLAALAVASTASAQTVIRITGATAYRSAVHTAIGNILNTGYTYGYSGSSLSGAGQAEFRGTTKVGNYDVDIKTSFSGSLAGIATLTTDRTIANFLDATNLTTGGTASLTGPYDSPVTADVTFSDAAQATTRFKTPALVNNNVGVIPFVWTRNNGSTNSIANMTSQLAQALLANGQVPLSMFSGSETDSGIPVILVGRDADSGTRLTAFAESGYGALTMPVQYKITGSNPITLIDFYPTNTIEGTFYDLGQSGYASGGDIKTALNAIGTQAYTDSNFDAGCHAVGYLSTSDAAGVNGGANNLTYNGYAYSLDNVKQGLYSFWSYEHMLWRSGLSGTKLTVSQQLRDRILNYDATIKLGDMKVTRQSEGAVITR